MSRDFMLLRASSGIASAALALTSAAPLSARAQALTMLHNFTGGDGKTPDAVTPETSTAHTQAGGAHHYCGGGGYGAGFKLSQKNST